MDPPTDDGQFVAGSTALRLRSALPTDAPTLAEVAVRAVDATAGSSYSKAQVERWAASFTPETVTAAIRSTTVFVAEADSIAVGFANLVSHANGHGELALLYVDPDVARQGVGRALNSAIEAEARHRGLSTLVADASLLADPVLQHLGYRVLRRYEKVHLGEVYRNTWLIKDLG